MTFHVDDARLAGMHGYAPVIYQARSPVIDGWTGARVGTWEGFRWVGMDGRVKLQLPAVPGRREHALREAFRRVRRDVWSERESRLVAKWESYG